MAYFGMVSTAASKAYTPYALESFFRETPSACIEAFFLIDNDGSLDHSIVAPYPHATLLTNDQPMSFAQNANQVLDRAAADQADLYFLNNDLIFSKDWISPLESHSGSILSPMSNRERSYVKDLFRCERFLALEDYLGFEHEFETIAAHHRAHMTGYRAAISIPFFCIKIPHSVYTQVGRLDESFGIGGAEDNDYCLRVYLAGLKVEYALSSYVLHFSGRSTWNGAETPEQTRERDRQYKTRFIQKWGLPLQQLIIEGQPNVLLRSPEIQDAARREDFTRLIGLLQVQQ